MTNWQSPVPQTRGRSSRRCVTQPALRENFPSLFFLNRLVRTRMLGGVGAGEGDLPGYPIRPCGCRIDLADLTIIIGPAGSWRFDGLPVNQSAPCGHVSQAYGAGWLR